VPQVLRSSWTIGSLGRGNHRSAEATPVADARDADLVEKRSADARRWLSLPTSPVFIYGSRRKLLPKGSKHLHIAAILGCGPGAQIWSRDLRGVVYLPF